MRTFSTRLLWFSILEREVLVSFLGELLARAQTFYGPHSYGRLELSLLHSQMLPKGIRIVNPDLTLFSVRLGGHEVDLRSDGAQLGARYSQQTMVLHTPRSRLIAPPPFTGKGMHQVNPSNPTSNGIGQEKGRFT